MEPCALCGDHTAITEYFEDDLFYYCPKYDRTVSERELEEIIAFREEIHICELTDDYAHDNNTQTQGGM